ncbi:MAG: helix-turn-helix transcriptional regulator, partial [Erysipelotrichales bacterium]|nr:helix-turn-helix transcriptional regulator [Erysipelotrichales bacterium]
MAEKKELGEIIKTARSRKGLSQQKLADFLYVSRDKISSWENGRSEPVYSEILKMSEVLEVPVASFFPEDDGKVLENQEIDVSSQIKQIDWKI